MKRTKIEIIPMIDTIFFLLVFFILSSLSMTRLESFRVNLPKAEHASEQKDTDLVLTIDQKQNIFLNKESLSLDALRERLSAHAEREKHLDRTCVINADQGVPHGLVVRAMDIFQEAGIYRFALATTPLSQPASSGHP